ncbi:MAG TPA: 16S rRNA (uracil(1498)-N(3))-methyltransferase [Methylomirabilota bacterium]|nr:16S rRNA (uracil(1498)-N(3))-methyltransferase [Methylomirabilota bacterium]
MARFFLPRTKIQDKRGIIDGQELDHLRRVLRLGPGDQITVFDDAGWEHEAVIRSFSIGQAEIDILQSFQVERESSLEMTLALGLTKGEKMDFVVEKATELGIQTIAPFVSAYTVPKLDDSKIKKRIERWQKVALSAAKQSGRTRIPEILMLCNFGELVRQSFPNSVKLLFWEKETQRTLKDVRATEPQVRSLVLAIGPEGGFSEEEASMALAHGFSSIRLGRRILRAETAAVSAISVVQFLWGDLG